jgi:hypothetical protein
VNTGTITSIATTGPITGGPITTTGTIGINQANGSTDGYISSADWTTFNNKLSSVTISTTTPLTGGGTGSTFSLDVTNALAAGTPSQVYAKNGTTYGWYDISNLTSGGKMDIWQFLDPMPQTWIYAALDPASTLGDFENNVSYTLAENVVLTLPSPTAAISKKCIMMSVYNGMTVPKKITLTTPDTAHDFYKPTRYTCRISQAATNFTKKILVGNSNTITDHELIMTNTACSFYIGCINTQVNGVQTYKYLIFRSITDDNSDGGTYMVDGGI